MTSESICDYWNQQASLYGQDEQATMPDTYLRSLEIRNLTKYITPQDRILDVGCGNGFGTIFLARATANEVVGIDVAPKMIDRANDRLAKSEPDIRSRVRFMTGTVLNIPSALGVFDKVASARCLINLGDQEEQVEALRQIHGRLTEKGQAVLSEDTTEGLARINSLRQVVKLPEVAIRWHNHYLDVGYLMARIGKLFRLREIDEFSSTYYIISRVVNARLAADRKEEPRYDSDINKVAAQLPSIGEYGLLKIIVLERL
jgi:SAM-dependent methyltransferase